MGCVDPEVGPRAFERTSKDGVHPLVDLTAEPADLALRHAAGTHGFHQIAHRTRRDAVDVGFLDHRGERLLHRPARLQEALQVAARPRLRDLLRAPR
jgi:hypothetical protein